MSRHWVDRRVVPTLFLKVRVFVFEDFVTKEQWIEAKENMAELARGRMFRNKHALVDGSDQGWI